MKGKVIANSSVKGRSASALVKDGKLIELGDVLERIAKKEIQEKE